jgi:hypothetical protein
MKFYNNKMNTLDVNTRINSLFNDGESILKIIDGEGGIVKLLGYPSEKCKLIDNLQVGELLGEGQYGKAFIIKINNKDFVVKKVDLNLRIQTVKKENIISRLGIAGVSIKDFESLQPEKYLQKYINAKNDELVTIVIPPLPCIITNEIEYRPFPKDIGKRCIIPKGSYLCNDETFSEFVIGVYCGKLYRDRLCINFFDIFSLFTCRKKTDKESYIPGKEYNEKTNKINDVLLYSLQQYILMEKISGDLSDDIECLSIHTFDKIPSDKRGHAMNSFYVQVIFAIAMYQEKLKISHNDLHTGNVFIEHITPKTVFNNQNVYGSDWFHYRVKGKDIYIPYCSFIAKIGDFGLSIKYKIENTDPPMVGNKFIVETGFENADPVDGLVPNIFLVGYDLLYFSYAYVWLLRSHYEGHSKLSKSYSNSLPTLNNKPITSFIVRCIEFFGNLPLSTGNLDIVDRLNGNYGGKDPLIKINSGRPYLKKLVNVKSALQTLLGTIYDQYREKPKEGRIIFCGELQ